MEGVEEQAPLLRKNDERPARQVTGYSLFFLEAALFSNAFLAGFDATVTAATYTTISNSLHAASMASWVTTAYLLTYTAFLPLYGSFSDVLGRRKCFFFATFVFGVGCFGCGVSPNMLTLILLRAITGVGGAGLITMSTIINSDVISSDKRAMYQAFQNMFLGLGNICGASIGGMIADYFGWRWCFLSQVPICMLVLSAGYYFVIDNTEHSREKRDRPSVDISGSISLVLGLIFQLAGLSFGGDLFEWSDYRILLLFVASGAFLILFILIESKTKSVPIVPLSMVKPLKSIVQIIMHACIGMTQFSYIFILPLIFQVVLGDSPSKAGFRLMIPALSTPIGAVVTGTVSSRYPNSNSLKYLVMSGSLLMLIGNLLALKLSENLNPVLFGLYLVPANFGLGMTLPASLFTYVFTFDKSKQAVSTSIAYLSRGMGAVWGVAASSAIIQSQVTNGILDKIAPPSKAEQIIDRLKDSVSYIDHLNKHQRQIVIAIYDKSLKLALVFSITCCFVAFAISLIIPRTRQHT
ncbi:hypothetical protein TRICI_005702 [Trichomonascus ciferrii]|uniref:Major facilitator superfamily (MFS) profile domain-containing protein n=1 Tax=Trichomonascus ciferrii TaxID=44093 RepID=A0A642UQ04_9ASCO|nr:hypothetical protein TRICI_005702 [Trichomonascus ciferrii]